MTKPEAVYQIGSTPVPEPDTFAALLGHDPRLNELTDSIEFGELLSESGI